MHPVNSSRIVRKYLQTGEFREIWIETYNFVTTEVGEERVRAISTNRGGRHECMNIFIEVSKEN